MTTNQHGSVVMPINIPSISIEELGIYHLDNILVNMGTEVEGVNGDHLKNKGGDIEGVEVLEINIS